MTTAELCQIAEQLEREICGAPAARRIRLQPKFSNVLKQMHDAGAVVPPRLRSLDSILIEEVIEDRFDNMPV